MIFCENCQQQREGDLHGVTLNVRGVAISEWKVCRSCAEVIPGAVRAALQSRQPVASADLPTEGAIAWDGKGPTSLCEVCGRLCLDATFRCALHPRESESTDGR